MKIKIGGIEKDLSAYDMQLISSPEAFGVKIKSSNIVKTDFPEEDGDVVYIPANPSVESFDYNLRLAVVTKIGESPSAKVSAFVNEIIGKKIQVKNTNKGTMIEGYFSGYKDVQYYNERVSVFEITIYVPSGKVTIL